jgi:hypothetical protein
VFTLRIICKCGFASEQGVWGPPSMGDEVGVPVYFPASGRLITHWFVSEELRIRPEQLDQWIAANGGKVIAEKYGPDAVAVNPPTSSEERFVCPKCSCDEAQVEIVGIH